MKKNLLRSLLALLLMVLLLLTAPVTIADEQLTPIPETITLEGAADNDELFAQYVENLFYKDVDGYSPPFSTGNRTAGSRLSGEAKKMYDALVPFVKEVAAGQRTSTSFEFDQDQRPAFAASEYQEQAGLVIRALLFDFPYEMYWNDKTNGNQYWRITSGDQVYITQYDFAVAEAYATSNDYEVDTATTGVPARALANAKAIVTNNKSKSDRGKLEAYMMAISDLVNYNHSAADNEDTPYGDPWQMIWVFDGNTSTDVVCEGYAKSFQYLCYISTWNGNVQCYSVTGGNHMWNIVSIDGTNYLTDITGCDPETNGRYTYSFFLQLPVSGSVDDGYTLSNGTKYTYYDKTKMSWGEGVLTLGEVPQLAITSQPQSVIVANGATARVSVAATGDGLTYAWYVKAVGKSDFTKSSITARAYSVTMNPDRNGNQVYCVVKDKYGFSIKTDTVTIQMQVPAAITTQPRSVTVAKGKMATVTVGAIGDGLTYTWYVKEVGASGFSRSSITASSYSVTMTDARNGNQLYCVVKDKYGNSVQTNTVTIQMPKPVAITTQPKSVIVAEGAKATLTVGATGDGLTYTWYVKEVGASGFSRSSITASSYSVTMTDARNGNQLYCVVKDKYGNTAKTNTVTIQMKGPITITTQPKSVTVVKGATAKVTISATGDGLTYTWYVKAVGKTSFAKSSISGKTYAVAMTAARNGNQLYCLVKDKNGNSLKSNVVTIKMVAPVTITTQPKSVTVAKGATAKLTVGATGEGLTYAWYLKAVGKTSFSKSSVTGSTYSVTMTDARNGNQLYCVVKDQYGNTAKSNTVTIKMKACEHERLCSKYVCLHCGAYYAGDHVMHEAVFVENRGYNATNHWYTCSACGGIDEDTVEPHYRNCDENTCYCGAPYTGANVWHGYQYAYDDIHHWEECLYCGDKGDKELHDCLFDDEGTGYCECGAEIRMGIVEQPRSVTVKEGEMARVSVQAVGGGLTYSWYVKSVGKSSFTKSSITTKTYSVAMNAARNGNQLYCVVKDSYGNSVKSNTVTIKMSSASANALLAATEGMLAIENTDPQTVNVNEGGMHTMSVTATGGTMPYSYQWYVNKGRGYETVEGATNATYTTSPADHTTSGYSYYCVVTDGSGNTVTGPVYTVLVAGEDAAPATGDNSLVELWAVLCIISAGACLMLMKRRKSER